MNLREPSAVAFALRSALDPTEETASIFEWFNWVILDATVLKCRTKSLEIGSWLIFYSFFWVFFVYLGQAGTAVSARHVVEAVGFDAEEAPHQTARERLHFRNLRTRFDDLKNQTETGTKNQEKKQNKLDHTVNPFQPQPIVSTRYKKIDRKTYL